ncbi:MAG: gliding motility-associated C-terminal domain-containing protein [Bacteroidales bacterium]|nr:gliding motility-associated C-terminal domain-containing protein [Bacteroidales bacterium]HOY39759.1 gliding motility-associated C-terminal domain-containing protein [Bacteroidales bacterium]
MNKFEQIINERLKNFEAAEIPNAWEDFSKKLPRNAPPPPKGKLGYWLGGAAVLTATIIIIYMAFNDGINANKLTQHKPANKANIVSPSLPTDNSNVQKTAPALTEKNNLSVPAPDNKNNTVAVPQQVTQKESGSEKLNTTTIDVTEDNVDNKTSASTPETNQINNSDNNASSVDISNITADLNIISQCQPAQVLFSVSNLPESCSVNWITGTEENSNLPETEFQYAEAGTFYPVCMIYNKEGEVVRTFKLSEIMVFPSPNADFTFESKNNLYTFNTLTENVVNYQWELDNQKFSTANLDYRFSKEGNYMVKLIVKNEMGCKSEKSEMISVTINHNYYVPNAFKPFSDGVNSTFGPIGDNLFDYSFKMLIFDKTGKLIFETNNVEHLWNGRINGTGVMAEPGVYSWEIMTTDKYGNYKHKKGQVTLLMN